MLRLTQILRRLLSPGTGKRPGPGFHGPVVVWNLIRRCNLDCRHCYSASSNRAFDGELDTGEVFRVLDELKEAQVPAVILSGGEPLMRPDLFQIAARAKDMGFYLALSTNGTLIDGAMADQISAAGFNYVGISVDGLEENHDRIRGRKGAFSESLSGIRRCLERDVKVGIRFTPTRENGDDLPRLFALMLEEGIPRFYLSHWNYAGRGKVNRGEDSALLSTRSLVETLIQTALADIEAGREREVVTGNNDADGVFLLLWLRQHRPELAEAAERILLRWGGNASGVGIANIDNRGNVHPDIFWWNHTLGNVREARFGDIWQDASDPLLAGLRQKPRPVKGRCRACAFLAICGGNTRVRAQEAFGDPWAEDPGCYLTDPEIGVS